jgi:putative restriction endonuclease
MRFYVGVTDHSWFNYLRSLANVDEVNFWQPSPGPQFRVLGKGDLFLFKLHRSERTGNRDLIVGGGVYASYTILPVSLAWEAFEDRNGAESYSEMRRQLLRYRKTAAKPQEDFQVGCIILTQPFFFDEAQWFPVPDWSQSIVRGKAKGYEMDSPAGQFIWKNLQDAWAKVRAFDLNEQARRIEDERARYGKETVIRPRLGQRAFKILVTDAYGRACAITEEHSLPVLEAAHIKPFSESGPHAVNNGLLLRSDFHRLFDRGYITVTPEYRIEISRRLKEEFENGRSYYPFHGQALNHLPAVPADRPQKELLAWHNENLFRE